MPASGLKIISPKRDRRHMTGWEGFSPYYAGYPEQFATNIIASANIAPGSKVFDPWNGSGTTTFVAANHGMRAVGFDLNPVMVLVSKARMLAPSEADSIVPLGAQILKESNSLRQPLAEGDPLLSWFSTESAAYIRAIEMSIRTTLVGDRTIRADTNDISNMSSIASSIYLVLFAIARSLTSTFRSSNPTWLRTARTPFDRVNPSANEIGTAFLAQIATFSEAISKDNRSQNLNSAVTQIVQRDSATDSLAPGSVDFVLTSPPYCTRIDYTAATRVQLAVLQPLLNEDRRSLGKKMLGSTQVPDKVPDVASTWGGACEAFLARVRSHHSKASATYYYKTHLDYFDKLYRSITNTSMSIKHGGVAIFVVQDSFYKDIHNDLQSIVIEMAETSGLKLRRRDDFLVRGTLASSHPGTRRYRNRADAVESVICFEKVSQ